MILNSTLEVDPRGTRKDVSVLASRLHEAKFIIGILEDALSALLPPVPDLPAPPLPTGVPPPGRLLFAQQPTSRTDAGPSPQRTGGLFSPPTPLLMSDMGMGMRRGFLSAYTLKTPPAKTTPPAAAPPAPAPPPPPPLFLAAVLAGSGQFQANTAFTAKAAIAVAAARWWRRCGRGCSWSARRPRANPRSPFAPTAPTVRSPAQLRRSLPSFAGKDRCLPQLAHP